MAGDSVRLSKNLMRMKVESSTGISTFVPTSSMMSEVMDETAGDRPVRDNDKAGDVRVHPSFLSRMAREDLEDHFLNQKEDIQRLKQQINKQDDKYKKLGTKLSRLVKDRRRMEHLVAGPAAPLSNVEMEEVVEELQDKVRALQTDKETLSRRLLLVRQQQLNSQSQRAGPYAHVKPRVNTGAKRSGSSSPAARLRGTRSVDAAVHPQYGHGLLEEARAEIRNLENRVETQCSQIEELRAELQRKEEEHEDRLQQLRQQQTHNLRSHVDGNVVMIKLQKQLTERSNAFSELEERFICLKETQQTLKLGHELAVQKVEDLTTELKEQQRKTLELEQREQSFNLSKMSMNMLEERICELEQERQLLKENNNLLLSRLELDMVQQQKYDQVNRQQRLQISQLEKALRADLADKNDILEQIRAERDSKMKLSEESQRLQQQLLEHQQQVKELKESRTVEYDHSELTEALLIVKSRRAQKNADLRFLKDEETSEINVREMQAAHAESIQELQKTRELLVVESQISQGYKAELEGLFHQMKSIKAQSEEKLEKQRHLLESREAKIRSLQAQLKDMMYGSKCSALGPDGGAADRDCDGSVQLERGENLLELQLESASLSPSILQVLGEDEPSTFCTYAFYLFGLHSTPMVVGTNPLYDFTSRYVVRVDEQLLQYLRAEQLTVELHHNQGLTWKTIAQASIPLVALTEQDAPLRGSTPLVGEDCGFIGSLNYCLRMKIPIHDIITESLGSTSSQHSQATDEEEHEEEDEEVSCVSTGELLTDTPQFTEEHDDGSEVSIQSDSDDCIVHSSSVRKPSLRLDILCLSLRANSSVSLDPNVVNLFMEFSFLGLQTVETPLSLPKPAPDCRAHYNYSKAILVDTEENSAQRALLRKALLGNDPTSSRVVFTVVSEPPPDEQQDRDCEEVGVAFIELSELLEKHENLMEANLKVLSVVDRSEVIGFLTVSFEGLHTLRSIMDDYEDDVNDKDKCFSSSSRPKT
ncbi:protein fantom-like isoform X8 [Gouania willdenowi]|uniref:protein fantom-like isoform X8 n=1 Tax=Gouania willdenowi TaxID=441366 RepID=UPI001055B61D|nr:protein fantom-like isoform X8 [Gouania willdenowi]